jgi:hypothetical protein
MSVQSIGNGRGVVGVSVVAVVVVEGIVEDDVLIVVDVDVLVEGIVGVIVVLFVGRLVTGRNTGGLSFAKFAVKDFV